MKTKMRMNRICALALSAAFSASGFMFVGCQPAIDNPGTSGGGVVTDKTKSQLTVANYDGGVGSGWFYKVVEAFEEKYANHSFEEGKMGVQIVYDVSKADHLSQIKSDPYNVIFAESVDVNAMIASNEILNISDIVKAVGEDGKTIESKLSTSQKAMLSTYGDYYALPHYEYYPGLTYDKKVFNEESLYISADGGYTDADGNLSAGPDGKLGTYDDGLPATIEQFIDLCTHISEDTTVAPFIYGMISYTDVILEGFTASLQSEDEFMLNFTFDSTKGGELSDSDTIKMDVVTGWNGDTPIVEAKEITPATGYLTSQNAQKYYALQLLEQIMHNTDTFIHSEVTSTTGHTEAQRKFIFSDLKGSEPAAMLIEGSFWYNEAKTSNAFTDSVNQYGERAKNRDFAWMPLPTAVSGTVDETNGRSFKLVDEANSYAVINANIKNDPVKVELAKLFLQYCYTDANLELFTSSTGCFKALEYSLSDATYNSLDNFYKSIADIRKENGVIRPLSGNAIYANNQNAFMWMRTKYFKTPLYANAATVFKGNRATAKDFFTGMKQTESDWNKYSTYFSK